MKKYKYERRIIQFKISDELNKLIDEMAYDLKITKNDIIISSIINLLDKTNTVIDNENLPKILRWMYNFGC